MQQILLNALSLREDFYKDYIKKEPKLADACKHCLSELDFIKRLIKLTIKEDLCQQL